MNICCISYGHNLCRLFGYDKSRGNCSNAMMDREDERMFIPVMKILRAKTDCRFNCLIQHTCASDNFDILYKCQICEQIIASSNLRKHELSHTSKCLVCDNLLDETDVIKHRLTHLSCSRNFPKRRKSTDIKEETCNAETISPSDFVGERSLVLTETGFRESKTDALGVKHDANKNIGGSSFIPPKSCERVMKKLRNIKPKNISLYMSSESCETQQVKKTKINSVQKGIDVGLPVHKAVHVDNYQTCKICDKNFKSLQHLNKHLANTHIPWVEDCCLCELCGLNIPSKDYHEHLRKDHGNVRKFHCRICDNSYKTKIDLQHHTLKHTGERPFQCTICGKGFRRKCTLIDHERVHSQERKFHCKICNYRFKTNAHLQSHILMHSAERPFQCKICGKGFRTKSNLIRHEPVHTGERKYQCEYCGQKFSYSSGKMRHLRNNLCKNVSIMKSEKPFQCTICGTWFSKYAHLEVHQNSHAQDNSTVVEFNENNERQCKYCSQFFFDHSDCVTHMQNEHGKCRNGRSTLQAKSLQMQEQIYDCCKCDAKFTEFSDWQKHRKSHEISPASLSYETSLILTETGLKELTTNVLGVKDDTYIASNNFTKHKTHERVYHGKSKCDNENQALSDKNEVDDSSKFLFTSQVNENELDVNEVCKSLSSCSEFTLLSEDNTISHAIKSFTPSKTTIDSVQNEKSTSAGIEDVRNLSIDQIIYRDHAYSNTLLREGCHKYDGDSKKDAHNEKENRTDEKQNDCPDEGQHVNEMYNTLFENADNIKRHKSDHLIEINSLRKFQRFFCEVCSKSFSTRSGMKEHQKSAHSKEDNIFKRNSNSIKGVERYICSCGYNSFECGSTLKGHFLKHNQPCEHLSSRSNCVRSSVGDTSLNALVLKKQSDQQSQHNQTHEYLSSNCVHSAVGNTSLNVVDSKEQRSQYSEVPIEVFGFNQDGTIINHGKYYSEKRKSIVTTFSDNQANTKFSSKIQKLYVCTD